MRFAKLKNSIQKEVEQRIDSPSHGKIYDDVYQDDFEENTTQTPTVLDAYFALLHYEAGEDKEIGEDKKKTIKTQKISCEKISERGLSYQAAIIIETANLTGEKITVRIKSGKEKVLSEIDETVKLIDMADVDIIKDASKYKNIQAKDSFEVEVGALSKDIKIENSSDFENKAVLRLMLNGRADDLSFDMAKKIIKWEDGVELNKTYNDMSAYLYVEVDSLEQNTEYKGYGEKNNQFLNNEDQYFKIKYLEQPWIVKAREEQQAKVNESTIEGQNKIKKYHQVNREHKPKGYSGITNAWCASFVGWCLTNANYSIKYSAQLDPGAYTYGNVQTISRKNDFKFFDPVWAQKTKNNKLALGSITVVGSRKHVTFAIAENATRKYYYGLGGNQGDSVKISPYSTRNSSLYPIEYQIKETDYELPIYFRPTTAESTT